MNLGEMIKAINRLVDDVVLNEDAVQWLNAGKDIMAVEIGANFPDIQITADMSDTFVFPEKYHEIPVLYAAAKFKEQDSSLAEANNFLTQFFDRVRKFVLEYEVPPQYRDDRLSQQFIAAPNQTTFTITKNGYDPTYGDLKVYIDGQIWNNVTINSDKSFTIKGRTFAGGERVTAVWEEHQDLIEPPYNWWRW